MVKAEVALVTGAAGFIGANLVRRLCEEKCEVHALLQDGQLPWRLQGIQQKIHTHVADLTDSKRIESLVCDIQPDTVYHLATYGGYPGQTDVHKTFLTNVMGSLNLFTSLESIGSVKNVVSSGTSSEYGSKNEPMREDHLLEPNTAYGVAKSAQTHLTQYFARQRALPLITLRLLSVYGPYEAAGRLLSDIMRALVKGESVRLSSPTPRRDFIFIEDVLDAFRAAASRPDLRGHVFNIGSGKELSVGEMVECAMNTLGTRVPIEWGAVANPRTFETIHWVADISKAKDVLGWEPRHSLSEGIKKTFAWYRDNLSVYQNA